MFRSILVLSAVVLFFADVGEAQQDAAGLVPGSRIRVHSRGSKNIIGTFLSLDSASMSVVTAPGDTATILRSTITGLDVADGTKSSRGNSAVKGLWIGGLIGGAVGIPLGVAAENSYVDAGIPAYAAATGVLFAGIGAGLGALWSSGSQTDRWAKTTWPIVAIGPGTSGVRQVAVGLHLAF